MKKGKKFEPNFDTTDSEAPVSPRKVTLSRSQYYKLPSIHDPLPAKTSSSEARKNTVGATSGKGRGKEKREKDYKEEPIQNADERIRGRTKRKRDIIFCSHFNDVCRSFNKVFQIACNRVMSRYIQGDQPVSAYSWGIHFCLK